MEICLLTAREVGRLRNHNIRPSHKDHRHIASWEATEGIESTQLLVVEEAQSFDMFAVTESASGYYVWKVRKSGGADVRQMVRLVQG